MHIPSKQLLVAGVVAGALTLGGLGFVAAQTGSYSHLGMLGHNMNHHHADMHMGGMAPDSSAFTAIHQAAESAMSAALGGETMDQVHQALASGKTLDQIAQEHGTTLQAVQDAVTAAVQPLLDQAVQAGTLTAAQEQQMLSAMQTDMGFGGMQSHHPGMDMMLGSNGDRQSEVAARGAQVMSFDLTRTSHTFTDLADGGRESVVANDPSDAQQVALIRMHLQSEAQKFSSGNFSDPAEIHGNDMPGLAQLQAGYTSIQFQYEALPNGAAITYRTANPALVQAIHTWFAAQRSDHGSH
jgi:hypothetical protein